MALISGDIVLFFYLTAVYTSYDISSFSVRIRCIFQIHYLEHSRKEKDFGENCPRTCRDACHPSVDFSARKLWWPNLYIWLGGLYSI